MNFVTKQEIREVECIIKLSFILDVLLPLAIHRIEIWRKSKNIYLLFTGQMVKCATVFFATIVKQSNEQIKFLVDIGQLEAINMVAMIFFQETLTTIQLITCYRWTTRRTSSYVSCHYIWRHSNCSPATLSAVYSSVIMTVSKSSVVFYPMLLSHNLSDVYSYCFSFVSILKNIF